MTDKAKRQIAMALLGLAVFLGVVAALTWNVGEGKDPNPYREAFGLSPDPPKKESDHVVSFLLIGGGALSIICSVILLATSQPPRPPSNDETDVS